MWSAVNHEGAAGTGTGAWSCELVRGVYYSVATHDDAFTSTRAESV